MSSRSKPYEELWKLVRADELNASDTVYHYGVIETIHEIKIHGNETISIASSPASYRTGVWRENIPNSRMIFRKIRADEIAGLANPESEAESV